MRARVRGPGNGVNSPSAGSAALMQPGLRAPRNKVDAVGIGAPVAAGGGTEDREFDYVIAAAEFGDLFAGEIEAARSHASDLPPRLRGHAIHKPRQHLLRPILPNLRAPSDEKSSTRWTS